MLRLHKVCTGLVVHELSFVMDLPGHLMDVLCFCMDLGNVLIEHSDLIAVLASLLVNLQYMLVE